MPGINHIGKNIISKAQKILVTINESLFSWYAIIHIRSVLLTSHLLSCQNSNIDKDYLAAKRSRNGSAKKEINWKRCRYTSLNGATNQCTFGQPSSNSL